MTELSRGESRREKARGPVHLLGLVMAKASVTEGFRWAPEIDAVV